MLLEQGTAGIVGHCHVHLMCAWGKHRLHERACVDIIHPLPVLNVPYSEFSKRVAESPMFRIALLVVTQIIIDVRHSHYIICL